MESTAKILTLNEVKATVHEDDYAWIEFHHWRHFDGDEVYHLRCHIIQALSMDFSEPQDLISCEYDDYGIGWRIWSDCPDYEQLTTTEWDAE